MTLVLPSVYSQFDSRWANILLGFNTNPVYNFYNYACLISCLAMVAKYYGKDDNPVTINNKLKELKPTAGYAPGGGLYNWGSFPKIYGDIQELRRVTPSALSDSQMGEIRSAIEAGNPVMLHLDADPKDVDNDMHFVLAIGYNPSDENDITIADPLGGKIRSLKDYLGWYKPSARSTIEQYVIYKGPVPTVNAGCLVPNTQEWRTTYEKIIRGSGEWDKTVAEIIGSSADPKTTSFENIRNTVNGFKSRITDLTRQVGEKDKSLHEALVEVENQKDKVANVENECQQKLAIKDAQINALNSSSKDIEKLKESYDRTIAAMQTELRELQKAGGEKDLEIVNLRSDLDICKKSGGNVVVDKGMLQKVLDVLSSLLKK